MLQASPWPGYGPLVTDESEAARKLELKPPRRRFECRERVVRKANGLGRWSPV